MPLLTVGIPRGSQRCSKAAPFFVLHNSQLTFPIKVSLSILESGCSELPLAYHFNPVAPSLCRLEASSTSMVPCPTLSPFGSPHQACHKSWVSFQCLVCALGIAGTPKRDMHDKEGTKERLVLLRDKQQIQEEYGTLCIAAVSPQISHQQH
jgi:hypothetical protein